MISISAMTLSQIRKVIFTVTKEITGYDDQNIRRAYQPKGAPFQNLSDNCIYYFVSYADDYINRQVHTVYASADDPYVRQTKYITRVINVLWSAYGESAIDALANLRAQLLFGEAKDILNSNGLYLIPDIPEVYYLPELFQEQWWDRADLNVRFNCLISNEKPVGTIGTVEISLNSEGKISNLEIKAD